MNATKPSSFVVLLTEQVMAPKRALRFAPAETVWGLSLDSPAPCRRTTPTNTTGRRPRAPGERRSAGDCSRPSRTLVAHALRASAETPAIACDPLANELFPGLPTLETTPEDTPGMLHRAASVLAHKRRARACTVRRARLRGRTARTPHRRFRCSRGTRRDKPRPRRRALARACSSDR